MKRVKAADFPELQRVFSAYLHEDFLEEYETPANALRAFEQDANAAERRRFRAEAARFLELAKSLEMKKVRALLSQLGSRWNPPSRDALIAWLSALDG